MREIDSSQATDLPELDVIFQPGEVGLVEPPYEQEQFAANPVENFAVEKPPAEPKELSSEIEETLTSDVPEGKLGKDPLKALTSSSLDKLTGLVESFSDYPELMENWVEGIEDALDERDSAATADIVSDGSLVLHDGRSAFGLMIGQDGKTSVRPISRYGGNFIVEPGEVLGVKPQQAYDAFRISAKGPPPPLQIK